MGLRSYLRGDNIEIPTIEPSESRGLSHETIPSATWDAWVPRGRPLKRVSKQNAMAVATAWSCVKLLADGISTLPLRVYRRLADGSRVPAGPDQRLAQLLARPWPGATSIDLVSQIVLHLSLYGEAWLAKYISEGSIISLGLLHPDRMHIEMKGQRAVYSVDVVFPTTGPRTSSTSAA